MYGGELKRTFLACRYVYVFTLKAKLGFRVKGPLWTEGSYIGHRQIPIILSHIRPYMDHRETSQVN